LSEYKKIKPYITKDGSLIRELMHPKVYGNKRQSLAEATITPGHSTLFHSHQGSEELYHLTAGKGLMTLGEEQFEVNAGDTICIPPGDPHQIQNTGEDDLRLLCCCAPPYSHSDTLLLTGPHRKRERLSGNH
jgi:mannose-6-phosphate isomerase-like protein (cupin superfamily)